ncbi:lipoate--protein ligase family protein [Companilactobacillus sp. DQM5]|uniref:lipoate--protein ligase family protein n=1 Tax=Companilactobacillus sp. DQM5 TaxID=3463359 RepID=UPI004058D5D8
MLKNLDTLLLYDRNYKQPTKIYLPFAENNVLLKSLESDTILNFWTMDDTVILGMTDQRLPNLTEGLKIFKKNNYKYFVRNSGGLAVINDKDILNISLFIPRKKYNLSIDSAYQIMVDLIQLSIPEKKIDVKEIANSYCPGDFDLSINGKKFAGISQRRVTNGIVVMAYLSITGNQNKRSLLIKNFYSKSNIPKNEKYTYPDVDPAVMENLDVLLNKHMSIEEYKKSIFNSLPTIKLDSKTLNLYTQTQEYQEQLDIALNDLKTRNKNIIL